MSRSLLIKDNHVQVVNVKTGDIRTTDMMTGVHVVRDVYCIRCLVSLSLSLSLSFSYILFPVLLSLYPSLLTDSIISFDLSVKIENYYNTGMHNFYNVFVFREVLP